VNKEEQQADFHGSESQPRDYAAASSDPVRFDRCIF
jgi:hypothetical protein